MIEPDLCGAKSAQKCGILLFFFLKILSFVFPNKKSKMKFPLILEFPVKKFRDQVDFLFVDKHQFPTS